MKPVMTLIAVAAAATLFLFLLLAGTADSNTAAQPILSIESAPESVPADLIVGEVHGRPLVNITTQSVFGPDSCTAAGDPVSPGPGWNPWWDEQLGSYHYRIQIPADYPYDLVRVEL